MSSELGSQPRPAASVTSLLSASSSSSAASGSSTSGQSSSMAAATAVHKMDAELRCPSCRRYFHCPVLLPCGHSLCTSCASGAILPATEPSIAAAVQAVLHLSSSEAYASGTGASYSSASSTTGSSIGSGGPQTGSGSTLTTNPSSSTIHQSGSSHSDSDQVSVVSETDSGVVVTSRPGSCVGRLPVIICQSATGGQNLPATAFSAISCGLICPSCNRIVGLFDEKGLAHLPRNKALERVISKFVSPEILQPKANTAASTAEYGTYPILTNNDPLTRPGGPLCQLCEEPEIDPTSAGYVETRNPAATWCEQCDIFYCDSCRERCHPSRGPLMRHVLHAAAKGVEIIRHKRLNQPPPCPQHSQLFLNLFCVNCHIPLCQECLATEGSQTQESHGKHEVHPLNAVCKAKKTELSQALQSLSEKARAGSEYIQRLRFQSETVKQTLTESERQTEAQLSMLIAALENKKAELTARLREARESTVHNLKDQITQVTSMLTRSTGLIQFCIEMLKESDPTAFLVVSQSLISRAQETEQQFSHELEQPSAAINETAEALLKLTLSTASAVVVPGQMEKCVTSKKSKECAHVCTDPRLRQRISEFILDSTVVETIKQAIEGLGLKEDQNKSTVECDSFGTHGTQAAEVPAPPAFIVEECISERNIITLVWQPCSSVPVERYTLELDDGANGNFRKVYRGPETMCTVEGLHFRSVYRARVRAHNQAGESACSERLCLQTSDLTWFNLDGSNAPAELLLTNGNRTITSQIPEDRVILGSTGLSRGVHYWEFTVDRCDQGGQPAFGIAKSDCNKEIMLGLDMRSWSVYFDYKRSWFLHNGEHFERTDGGVRAGSVVGVRLDCNRGSLSFYLNDEPHGPIAFTNLPAGVYYPAVSLTRAVQLTLHSGLEAPSESEESDEDSSGGGTGTETTSMATTVLAQPSCVSHSKQTNGSRQ